MKHSKILAFSVLLLLLSPAIAQQVDDRAKLVSVSHFLETKGFQKSFSTVLSLATIQSTEVNFINVRWSGERIDDEQYNELLIDLYYGYFEQPQDLANAFRVLKGTLGSVGPSSQVGEVDAIRTNGSASVFVKGHYVIGIGVAADPISGRLARNLLEDLQDELLNNILEAGEPPLPAFEVQFQKRVSPYFVDITLEGGIKPLYRWDLLKQRLDGTCETVFQSEPISLTQDPAGISIPLDMSGLEEGDYVFRILVSDALERARSFRDEIHLQSSKPDEVHLSVQKDSTLQLRNPHQNEGASPYLTLEKIQGKATRSAVAFDLSDVNLTDLTSATLRLTVDPSQGVNGWGNGDTISALPLSTGWVEGNGQSFGLKKKDQVAGSGSGVTWFSPVDSDISNDYANSTVQWNGGTTGTPTSPLIVMQNHYTGTVDFDVTNDLLNGQGQNGWLIKKDQENRGSKVTFYSREGAAAAGNTDLAPTLILNYGNSTASTNSPGSALLARMGWNSGTLNLKPTNPSSELKNLRQALKDSSTAAFVGDQLLQNATRSNPPLHVATAIAYRVWLG